MNQYKYINIYKTVCVEENGTRLEWFRRTSAVLE